MKKEKPVKPYPDYPLFPHDNGHWAKKIKGKTFYFGRWDDPDAALTEYERVRHDLYSGRTPAPHADGMTLKNVINLWLHEKAQRRDNDQLAADTWKEYRRVGKRIVDVLGDTVVATQLTPQDFTRLRDAITKGVAPKTGKGNVTKARVLFNWIFEAGYSPTPLPYRATLKAPSLSVIRRAKANKPLKLFTADEVLVLISKASGYMHPVLWLAINCGLGNRDAVELKWDYIDLKKGWIAYARPKTGIERRAKLWGDTVDALKAWRKLSPTSDYVCCGARGQQLGTGSNNTPIPHLFDGILEAAGVATGRGFYALRSTYRTIADESLDAAAIDLTMGHADHTMGGQYRQKIDNSRLEAVADVVRKWLSPSSSEPGVPSYV